MFNYGGYVNFFAESESTISFSEKPQEKSENRKKLKGRLKEDPSGNFTTDPLF